MPMSVSGWVLRRTAPRFDVWWKLHVWRELQPLLQLLLPLMPLLSVLLLLTLL